ncbi:MAG: hypothetical protein DHS20C17_26730 [Cyclobacteriaceae bacterium]|nr:MAG: hypothetical protein DHS20C17_26730 [Cyclobacteriaceae bacterium]
MQYRTLLSETVINPFGHPYVIIDLEKSILGVSGNTKAPLFTRPPANGLILDQILHPYLKGQFAASMDEALNHLGGVTDFIQLTGGYICRIQLMELPASENGQAFICFFECHHKKSLVGFNSTYSPVDSDGSNGFPKSDNIYNEAFHSAPMPLGIFKLKGCTVLEVNEAFLKLSGYTREELMGVSAFELGFWADRNDPSRIAQLLKDNYFIHNLEVRFRIRNGRVIDTILNLDLVDVDGVKCVVAVAQDITGIKQTEARLKENQQLLVSINENLNEGIYRSTPKNGFIYVNKAFARMFGLTVEEAIAINPEKLYANETDRKRVTKTLAKQGYLKNEQVEFIRRDGTTFWAFLSSILSRTSDGIPMYDGAIVDISDLRRSKLLLHEKNDELKKINAELDRFVYSASHDLRAPLTSLLGLVNITMLENSNPKLNNYLELMKSSVGKLDELISDIIHFSRNARLDIKPEPVHFENLVQETFNNLQYLPSAGSIESVISVEPYTHFYSDPKRLRILFNNLISNAFRYHDLSKQAPFIKVEVSFEKHMACVKVSDNGKGIHPDHVQNIFEMFYRATEDSQGSGLGLYIVKETIDKLQGSIQVHSIPRDGTTFTIELPNLEESSAKCS